MNQLAIKKIGKVKAYFFASLLMNIIVIGVYVLVFVQIQQKTTHISELSDSILSQEEKQNIFNTTKERFADTASERDKLDQYFIPKDGVVPFLNSLQALGQENGLPVKLNNVDILPPATTTSIFESVGVSLEGVGSWQDAYRFLSLVELMPLKVSVDRVDLGKNSDTSSVSKDKKTSTKEPTWRLRLDTSILKLK